MTLYPEQLRALDYLKRKGTDAPADEIRGKLADAFDKFEAAVAAVPVSLRQVAPGPGKWSVHEVLDHLVESNHPALGQLMMLLWGKTPEGPAIPASLQSADPLSRPWEQLVAELEALHTAFLKLLEGATDSHPLDVSAPVVILVEVQRPDGSLEPVQWEERLDWKAFVQALRVHTLEHLSQVTRTVAETSAVAD